MKILMISIDKDLFDENSEMRQRIIEYGNLTEELHVIVFNRYKLGEAVGTDMILASSKVFIYPTDSDSKFSYISDAKKITKKILKTHSHGLDLVTAQDPFMTGWVGYKIAKKFKIPLQIQIHTDFLSPYFKKESLLNRIRVLIAKFIIPKASCIRVVSERIKNSLLARGYWLVPEKIVVLPIFVDIGKIKNTSISIDLHKKYSQFDFIILMASRFTKEKNIKIAISAINEIIKEYPKTGLIIVGVGPEENNLKLKIKNLKLLNNVIIEPWNNDLISYYKTADLFLLTSNYEGYGRTIIEAAAAGCKIVSSNVGIADEVLDNNTIFQEGNEKELKEKIIKAIKGEIMPPKLFIFQTKEGYLNEHKKSWEMCGHFRREDSDSYF
jgi:glycosyltransferase involved in cell wall biosynthesis